MPVRAVLAGHPERKRALQWLGGMLPICICKLARGGALCMAGRLMQRACNMLHTGSGCKQGSWQGTLDLRDLATGPAASCETLKWRSRSTWRVRPLVRLLRCLTVLAQLRIVVLRPPLAQQLEPMDRSQSRARLTDRGAHALACELTELKWLLPPCWYKSRWLDMQLYLSAHSGAITVACKCREHPLPNAVGSSSRSLSWSTAI